MLIAVLLLLTVTLAGCSKDKSGTLPSGATLVSAAATKTRGVQSAHIKIDTSGEVTGLPIRRAEGDLLRSGDSKGTIQIAQLGVLIDYQFAVVGRTSTSRASPRLPVNPAVAHRSMTRQPS